MVLKATRSNILRLFWLSHLIDWKYFSFPKRLSLKWKQSSWCNEVYLKASSYVWKRFWRTTKMYMYPKLELDHVYQKLSQHFTCHVDILIMNILNRIKIHVIFFVTFSETSCYHTQKVFSIRIILTTFFVTVKRFFFLL